MSIFRYDGFAPLPINVRVTANTATTIVDATDSAMLVPWFQVNEHNGGTHNLTVDVYDGTNAVYVGDNDGTTWKARAVSAYRSFLFSQGLVIPKGSKLRVTSSDASGYFHVHGVYQIIARL